MSTFGLIELLALLTSLGDFGVAPNPKAPSAAEVMRYAPADADFMVHADLQAVVPKNYKVLKALPRSKAVKDAPGAREVVERVIREIDTGANMVETFTGVNPIEDVHSMTVWLQLPSAGDPEVLMVVRGKFAADLIDRLAKTSGGEVVESDGVKQLAVPGGAATLALKKGQLLLGTDAWLKPRLAKNWKAPRTKAGGAAARATALLRSKPLFAFVSSPSDMAVKRITQDIAQSDNLGVDLVSGHEFAAVTLGHNGVSWSVTARNQDGYERVVMASEGMLDLFRAGHMGARGLANVLMAGLPSYAGRGREIDMILAHKAEIMKLVSDVTGDGKFKVNFKKQAKRRTITVTATGKKLSDVLPIASLLPAVGAGFFLVARGGASAKQPAEAAAAQPKVVEPVSDADATARGHKSKAGAASARGLDVQSVYRTVKQARGL